MKKALALALTASLVLALASCGESTDNTSSAPASSSAPVVSATTAPVSSVISIIPMTPAPTEAPVENGNVALDGTAEDNGIEVYDGANTADLVNDGNTAGPGWQPSSFNAGDYVTITLAEAASIDTVVVYGEAATMSSIIDGGYQLLVRKAGEEDWSDVSQYSAESETADPTRVDTITLDEAVEIDALRLVLTGGVDTGKYAPAIYEIEIYAAEVEEEVE